jgi:hypothetical protein
MMDEEFQQVVVVLFLGMLVLFQRAIREVDREFL